MSKSDTTLGPGITVEAVVLYAGLQYNLGVAVTAILTADRGDDGGGLESLKAARDALDREIKHREVQARTRRRPGRPPGSRNKATPPKGKNLKITSVEPAENSGSPEPPKEVPEETPTPPPAAA